MTLKTSRANKQFGRRETEADTHLQGTNDYILKNEIKFSKS